MDNRIRQIKAFSLDGCHLGNQGYKRVLLQLFGYMGHGKSSFINSCRYVLNGGGPFVEYAKAGQSFDGGSMTMIRKAYELTRNITIVDNRGFRAMTDFERVEVYAQLGNFYPLNQKVEWRENFDDTMSALEESERNQNFTDFLVPIFIYSEKYILGRQEKEEVKSFLHNCIKMTGVFPIIVVTHKNRGHYLHIEKEFKLMGGEEIISIENYTKENHQKSQGRDADILTVIDSALRNVTFRLDQLRNPRRERIERRTFLLSYLHEAVVKAERERREFKNTNFTPIREVLERETRREEGDSFSIFKEIGRLLREQATFCNIL